jgi:hypothetical protein
VLGPIRRTQLPPLTRAEYKSAFDEAYAAQTAVVTTSTSVAASIPPTGDAAATITSINVILFAGMYVQKATTIYSDALTIGVYPALRRANLKETELGKSVRSTILSDYNFDPTMCDIHESGINASVAYMLLQNNPIRNYTTGELDSYIKFVNYEYVATAKDYINAFLVGIYWIFSPNNRFQPWMIKPVITRPGDPITTESEVDLRAGIRARTNNMLNQRLQDIVNSTINGTMDVRWAALLYGATIVPELPKPLGETTSQINNPKFYLVWLLYLFNRGYPVATAAVAVSLIAKRKVEIVDIAAIFTAFAEGVAPQFFTTSFAAVVLSRALNSIQNQAFRNVLFSSGLFDAIPIIPILAAYYGMFSLTYVALPLAQVIVAVLDAARKRGEATARDAELFAAQTDVRNSFRQLTSELGVLLPDLELQPLRDMTIQAMNLATGAARQAMSQRPTLPPVDPMIEKWNEYAAALNDFRLSAVGTAQARRDAKEALKRWLVSFGIPADEVDRTLLTMRNPKGEFQYYSNPAGTRFNVLSDSFIGLLETHQAEAARFIESYFSRAGAQPTIEQARVNIARSLITKFHARAASPDQLNRLARVLAVMFGVSDWVKVAKSEEEAEQEPGVNRDTFANEIIKFTPDWSLDHISASDMPANLRWFAYARRRKDIMDAFSAIFQAMGATKADTDAALNSLVNNGGFRSNGRHGSYPDFVAFLTKYSDAFKTFFARYPVDQRIQYGAIFCSRFFGLRGRTVLISKIFGLTYSDYRKLAQQTVPIDPVKMDFTWQDGDRPSGPEPTAAQLSAYERPTRRPVSRGGDL